MTWLTPLAWTGLLTLAIPIVIHLLVRQQSRRVAFPSLRFLQSTQMAALKRRSLQDWPLLIVRLLILAAAAAALAGPVVRWPGREAAWASRVSRAVIFEAGLGNQTFVLPQAYRMASFSRPDARAALLDAVRWLAAQPPSAREIAIAARFRRGWITDADLALIPPWVGIRLDPRDEPSPREQRLLFVERRDGQLFRVMRSMALADDVTGVREISAARIEAPPIVVTAGEGDRAAADAALAAILSRGVRWPDANQPISVPWPGSVTALADAIDRAVETPLDTLEPARVPAATLESWSRPPGPPPADAIPVDEGDRRFFWGLALALLGVEWWLRGRQTAAAAPHAATEVRVA